MTQLLALDVIETPTPAGQYVPSDGVNGPGRIAVEDLAAAGVTLQTAYDAGASITTGGPGPVVIGAANTAAAALSVTKDTGSGAIAGFIADYAGASVVITNADGSLTVRGDGVTTSASRLELGAGGVARAAIEGDQLRVPEGTAAAPGLAGDGTPGTGVRCAAAALGLSVAGTERAQITANGVLSGSRLGWTADATTYLSIGGGAINVTVGGTVVAFATSAGIVPGTDLADDLGTDDRRFGVVWQGSKMVLSSGTNAGSEAVEVTAATATTTNDTPQDIWSIEVPVNYAIIVEASIVGAQTSDPKTHFAATRIASMGVTAGPTVVLSTPATPFSHNLAVAAVTITNPSGQDIAVEVTGLAGTTIVWTATIRYQLVQAA